MGLITRPSHPIDIVGVPFAVIKNGDVFVLHDPVAPQNHANSGTNFPLVDVSSASAPLVMHLKTP